MRHLEVLVVTKNTTKPRILNWKVSTVSHVETALETLQQRPYKVVAISNTITEIEKIKFNKIVSILWSDVIIVAYNHDDTLAEIVKAAYWSTNKPRADRNYLDNSFDIKLASSINLN